MEPVSPLRSRIESVLLVSESPVGAAELARVLGGDLGDVEKHLRAWSRELDDRGSGLDLRESDEGWRLYTRAENAEAVEAFVLQGAQTRLSRAALETLAIVAYRQPVTRAQVSAVRGVNVDGVMRTLLLRGLVAEHEPDPATGALRYVTTQLFLDLLGLDSLDRLPDLAPLLPDIEQVDQAW
ncbi:Segregation and condensation protein B [Corynebacterium capitovis DSM 44611]|uniref:SMC-Scp complex subunit ScpB n=1 Tax=Corynebacterium capitovis TaxID=131081 RepID=UPI000366FB88|nr:SMC-Scp complex subunit ScpB [Corynebacterium capitovis]WKD57712.1 Segregation and condensation protein B [Corynebacterium capitovis DSM 44611]